MLDQVWRLVSWIVRLWSNLPKPIKDRVIELATECFDEIFRAFYRSAKAK
jgi:hypothetical protein